MFLRAPAAIATLLLVSCGSVRLPAPVVSPYRMEIQQGNFISQEMLSQLKLGMSKEQVRFVMGTALIADSFHADRWDYVFRRQKPSSRELEHHKLAVFFEGGKLVRMESDVLPVAGADADAVKTPVVKAEVPAPKLEAVAPKLEAPALRSEAVAPRAEAAAPRPEAPAPRAETVALKPEAPAAKPEAQKQPTSGAGPESKPAAQAAAEIPKPAPGAAPGKPDVAPISSGGQQPQEKKSWWDRLKDTVKF